MTWTKTPQEYPNRADVLSVSRSARWLLMELYSWSNAQLTDGRIPRSVLRRISDSEDVAADVEELLREGLAEEPEEGVLEIDWSNQEAAESVTSRAARNAEKTKRSRERKERHLGGDHSMCVAPYCKLGPVTPPVTGNATGNVKVSQPVTDESRNPENGGGVTPLRSGPVRSVRSKGKERTRGRVSDSAGATSERPLPERLNAEIPAGGVYLDPEIYGRNPTPMTPEQAARIDAMVARMEAEDDEANTLAGLLPAGGADG